MSAIPFRATGGAAIDGLYRRHAPAVYRYALAVLGNHADAEDVVQQTFLNAYRALGQGVKPRKAENWLLVIAHNQVRQHFRSIQSRPALVELPDELPAAARPEHEEPTVSDVLRALQHLPPAQREALVLREFEGRSYAEIAELMSLTTSALEALLFRARRSLAEQLEEALSCGDAEVALLRRLDDRLARRESRRLREHLRECPRCARFDQAQQRQRRLLKGFAALPVPASLVLFRGESAAAAVGLAAGGGAAASGGSAAAGLAGAGLATGLTAKVAAVTAAAAVTAGVGYGTVQATVVDHPRGKSGAAHARVVAKQASKHTPARGRPATAPGAAVKAAVAARTLPVAGAKGKTNGVPPARTRAAVAASRSLPAQARAIGLAQPRPAAAAPAAAAGAPRAQPTLQQTVAKSTPRSHPSLTPALPAQAQAQAGAQAQTQAGAHRGRKS